MSIILVSWDLFWLSLFSFTYSSPSIILLIMWNPKGNKWLPLQFKGQSERNFHINNWTSPYVIDLIFGKWQYGLYDFFYFFYFFLAVNMKKATTRLRSSQNIKKIIWKSLVQDFLLFFGWMKNVWSFLVLPFNICGWREDRSWCKELFWAEFSFFFLLVLHNT